MPPILSASPPLSRPQPPPSRWRVPPRARACPRWHHRSLPPSPPWLALEPSTSPLLRASSIPTGLTFAFLEPPRARHASPPNASTTVRGYCRRGCRDRRWLTWLALHWPSPSMIGPPTGAAWHVEPPTSTMVPGIVSSYELPCFRPGEEEEGASCLNRKSSRGLSAESKTHTNSVIRTCLLGLIKVSCWVLCAKCVFPLFLLIG